MQINDSSINHVSDSELFPVFVASGYDLTYFDEPLYLCDGIYMNLDGSLDYEDDAEDIEYSNSQYLKRKNDEEELENISDEELFSESKTGRILLHEFNETSRLDLLQVSNSINFALVNLIDTLPPQYITENDLLSAAIDSGVFASKSNNINFSENNQNLPSEEEILSLMVSDYNFAEAMTLNALGYNNTSTMKQALSSVRDLINNSPNPMSFSEAVYSIKIGTDLKKRDLAKAAIRLVLGEVNYENLSDAAVLSYLSHTH